MRLLLVLAVLLLLPWSCASAGLWGPDECADTVTITSGDLPYTITGSDTAYLIDGDITTAGNGITISSAHDVLIDGQGDSLYFGTTDGNSQYGLKITGGLNAYNIRIRNLSITHAPTNSTSDSCKALVIDGGKWVSFDTVNFHAVGHSTADSANEGNAIKNTNYSFYEIEFNGGRWSNSNVGYYNRMHLDGMVANIGEIGSWFDVSDTAYHFRITGVHVEGTGGIATKHRSMIYACSITVDSRNERWSYPADESWQGCANQAGIGLQEGWPGAMVRKNYIRAGTEYKGLDEGIIIQFAEGTTESGVYVDSNDVEVHFGFDPYYGWGLYSKAYKQRYGNSYAIVEHNRFVVIVGNTADSNYGRNGVAIMVSNGDNDGGPDSNCIIQNNYCQTIVNGSDWGYIRTILLGAGQNMTAGSYRMDSAGFVWRHNRIVTNSWAYELGGNDGTANGVSIWSDTVEFDTTISGADRIAVVIPNTYGGDQLNNYARDLYFSDGAPPTMLDIWSGDYEREGWLERTCSLLVTNESMEPLEGATVEAINAYGDTVATDTTGADGWGHMVLRYLYKADDTPDSTYNDFTWWATSGEMAGSVTMAVAWDNNADTLSISDAGGINSIISRRAFIKRLRRVIQ